ncbi:rhodanese-like domain-containing protein [Aurantiacibacter poecillastricola]|uniref:rhodanese-like domain-containing protein n=1 Tax=Aurantiacibacter poecillastricola TaxID=3064385 RepID=UPI00273FE3EC|nr:rhodanese-like domain-containing protein [Aurantiacibacter sp. 219JJ12-13]MDP5261115.1 rhodanese-like domain-containing protein [Aurantiacibacter sp. 219JJ12-13]
MFSFRKRPPLREISPGELHDLVADRAALVIDVREPGEFAVGHIPGAINLPLSRFDPHDLPDADGKRIVLNCAAGRRSALALRRCSGVPVDTHLRGGMGAWNRAGLPVER